jgi:hypothetical protein
MFLPVNEPLTGLRVVYPMSSRLASSSPLLSVHSLGPPRLNLSVVPLLMAVPVLVSVRRLLFVPLIPLSVFLHRAAAPLLVSLRDAFFATLVLYLPPLRMLGLYRARHLCISYTCYASSPCDSSRVWRC